MHLKLLKNHTWVKYSKPFILILVLFFQSGLKGSEPIPALRFKHFSRENGLSSSQINSIVMDPKGYTWIATRHGLNRFDGSSNKVYLHDKDDPYSISDNVIYRLIIDYKGRLIISTRTGLNLYDYNRDRFIFIRTRHGKEIYTNAITISDSIIIIGSTNFICKIDWSDTTLVTYSEILKNKTLNFNEIRFLYTDSFKRLWVCTNENGLFIYDFVNKTWQQIRTLHNNKGFTSSIREVTEDSRNTFWITTSAGLFHYTSSLELIRSYVYEPGNERSLSYNDCSALLCDNKERIWIGTSQGGLNLFDANKDCFIHYIHEPYYEFSIDDNSIQNIYEDKNNVLWVGTNKGINYFHEDMFIFQSVHNIPGSKNSLSHNIVTSFQEDSKGNLWIGTDGGGLNYWNRRKNEFTVYYDGFNNKNSFKSNSIFTICRDASGKLWTGGYQNGFSIFDPQNNSFKQFWDNSDLSVTSDVRCIIETKNRHIWIATNGNGLLEVKNNKIINKYLANPSDSLHSLPNNHILTLLEDSKGNLWIGTYSGLAKLDLMTRKMFSFYSKDNRSNLSDDWIYSMCEDSKGNLWFGTTKGLNLYNPRNNTFSVFDKKHGLPGDLINGIVEDSPQFLWLSTDVGLFKFDPVKKTGITYSADYGLQGNEFVQGAYFKNKKGDIFFGGFNGFSYFNPLSIKNKVVSPHILFSDLYFFDKRVLPGEEDSPLSGILDETKEIVLSNNQATMFSIQFLALEYLFPERIRYRYKIEGYNDRWIDAGNSRTITLTNLDAGTYNFFLQSTNSNGTWANNTRSIIITILPPFYKTTWAYFIYALLILFGGLTYHKYYSNLVHLKADLKLEKLQKEKAVELERIKSDFFTNITHEFRTPLTLILVPLQGLIENSEKHIKQQLLLMQKSAKRLLRLVNQVIDFKQIETGDLKVECRSIELISFTREIVESFIPLALNRNIHFHFKSDFPKYDIFIDPEKMDMVIYNLLSNAFKFTPASGDVIVSVSKASENGIKIIVEDSGPGIPEENLKRIFEKFYHTDVESFQKGTGIGLTLSRELVERHGGTLSAENRNTIGAKFIVSLPVSNNLPAENKEVEILSAGMNEPYNVSFEENYSNIILIVDDDLDVRECLRNEFNHDYQIIETTNGEEGYHKAIEIIPDLIICDIMMFEMDGLALCSRIKKHELTNHIPVILLTARSTLQQQIEGLSSGADDYITKPFNIDVLKMKLKNQLETRKKLRERFSAELHLQGKNIPVTDLDAEFIKRAISIVEDNLSDASLDIEKFSRLMGVSRSQLLRKIKSLTNETPQEFIRSIRLNQAATLLKNSKLSITEICYKTGFNYPAHFTHQFKLKFGSLPKDYRKEKENSTEKSLSHNNNSSDSQV